MPEKMPDNTELEAEYLRLGEKLASSGCRERWARPSENTGNEVSLASWRDAGVFYTPASVAWFICRRTIEGWLLNKIDPSGNRFPSIAQLFKAGKKADFERAIDALSSVRLLDTSCGTGNFLETSLEGLCLLRARIEKATGIDPDIGSIRHNILEHNIYGFDIDASALDVARKRLMVKNTSPNFACGNVLLDDCESLTGGRYDIVVGNPPYMRIKSMFSGKKDAPQLKKSLSKKIFGTGLYQYQDGNLNLYKLFIERNLGLLKDDGSMGLIFPSSFLNEATSTRLRCHIFDTSHVEEIVEIPESAMIFSGVSQSTAIMICHKGIKGNQLRLRCAADVDSIDGDAIMIDCDELWKITDGRMEVPLLKSPELEWAMLTQLQRHPPFRGDEYTLPVGRVSVGNLDETLDREFMSDLPTDNLLVKGIHLTEYIVDLSPDGARPRWVRKDAFLKKRPSAALAIGQPRIIGRNTQNKSCRRRLKFALLPEGLVCTNSIKQIYVTSPDIKPLYLLALLNSSVLNWYFEVFCSQNNIRNYSIEVLPVPRIPARTQEAFEFVAELIINSRPDKREFLDRMLMDAMVYELYFMDMKMLSSAVISSIDPDTDADSIMKDEHMAEIIRRIASREGFKIVQKAAYRIK